MKRFALKCLLLLLPIVLTVIVLNYFYTRTNYWKAIVDETSRIEKFTNVPKHIQLANLGSSHGYSSFDYGDIPFQSFDFSLSNQLFFYDYGILKQYVNHFEKNAVLFILISYFQITQIKTDFRDQRARYYRFLDKEYMDYYSIREKMIHNLVPVLTAGNNLSFIIKDIPSSQPQKPQVNFMTEPKLTENSIERHKQFTGGTGWTIEMGEEGFAYNKNLVSQIIDFCYAHDIKPVLVTTPITSVLNNIYMEKTPGFFDDFYRFTRELQQAYPSLPYFDYSHDPRFENDFTLFFDSHHLNSNGAKKFTAIVMSDLQASGLLPKTP